MRPFAIVGSVVAGIMMLASGIVGVRHLLEKGTLLNSAWLNASPEERETLNKHPYYRQTAVCYLLGCGYSLLMMLFFITGARIWNILACLMMTAVLVYYIASTILFRQKEDAKQQNSGKI